MRMDDKMQRRTRAKEFVLDLLSSLEDADRYELELQKLRITAAKYKALFYGKDCLSDKLCDQERENINACVGEFDGFSYSSESARAVFRTLEDMRDDGILTTEEFAFCDKP